ncbi:response regulator [Paenibacillus eucommiae]|uniref:Two-component system response regulator YesN n=1 Tax=Paenibacillus eucommiae TaxID=1355755 RepID=A0ABS4JA17_9BACL|nr:response regulator [Paenibacillus eucommiae]MBP1996678.1 two-component system response regulator YesN [Paenibacillus eucommiae]
MDLMIVEDEVQLLDNMAHNIPWEEHDIEVVATAGNGLEAIELFQLTKPDIVLLDIQMPEVDGITVAAHLATHFPAVKIIILSGHDDFYYAQKAIEFNVVKYLLKPAGFTEIVSAVMEAQKQIKNERDVLYKQELLQKTWEEHLPQLQASFYLHWVLGQYVGWEIERQSSDLKIDLSAITLFAVIVIDMDPLDEHETRFTDSDTSLLRFSLNQMAKEFFNDVSCCILKDYDDSTLLLFMEKTNKKESEFITEIHLLSSRFLTIVKEYLKVTASAGIGKALVHKDEVSESYKQARRALQERVIHGHNLAIPYRGKKDEFAEIPFNPPLEKMLSNALEIGNQEKAIEIVNELILLGVDQAKSVEEVQENVLYFSSLFVRTIHSQGWALKEVVGSNYDYFQNLYSLQTKEKIVQWLHSTVRSITQNAKERNRSNSHQLVEEMLHMIEETSDQAISLHLLAQKLYVNPTYLSRLFKQATGQSFTTYVLDRNMKLAMERLNAGTKVIHTARSLGYKDVSYFTKVFRKYWGVTPGEVRG